MCFWTFGLLAALAAAKKYGNVKRPDPLKLLFYIALAYWALVEYFWLVPFPQGHFVRCQLVYVVAAPLYKPLSLSMWASLMAVAHFAFWFRHHEKQPGKKEKEVLASP